MADDKELTREERLAAKLRENLRRRKAQARALEQGDSGPQDAPQAESPQGDSLAADSSAPLSKEHPSR